MDEYPLLPVAQEVAARYRPALEAEGWKVEVETNVPGTVVVRLEHPLVPEVHSFSSNSLRGTVPERTRRFFVECFETHYQFDVVRNAPIRAERHGVVRRLRGIATHPAFEAAGEAIISASYALYEEGILLREEADWLVEAIRRDIEEKQDR